ncbi:MAG: pyridoxamine 5'-phosphate oxidase [Lysobacterales bacterium]|jgi:pyridoxamine 5'-phosphate oxidase
MATETPKNILQEFQACLDDATHAGETEPTAMTIASFGLGSGISARTVLLKSFDAKGFVFYTNLNSRKGTQLLANSEAALVFHWKKIIRQVLIEGRVEQVSPEQADEYFASRDRGSQLGAWASDQSQALKSRAELLKRVVAVEAKYLGRTIPRPPHWTGLRVVPHLIEFWTGRKSRLHDRIRHTLEDGVWTKQRLFP